MYRSLIIAYYYRALTLGAGVGAVGAVGAIGAIGAVGAIGVATNVEAIL